MNAISYVKTGDSRRLTGVRRGLTLIEVIVSLILVSTILLISITASANLFRDQSQQRESVRAHELAGIFLDEISVRDFRDPDRNVTFGLEDDEVASDRLTFDDTDDYHAYTVNPPTYHDNTIIEGFNNWTVQVTVQPHTSDRGGISAASGSDAPLRLITVECTSTNGESVAESILVSEITSNISVNTAHDRLRRVNLSFSPDRQITVSVPLHNKPTVTN